QLTQQVLAQLQLTKDDIRVSFETVNTLLEQPIPAGQKWQIRPLNKTQVGTVQWEAQLLEKNRIVARLNVQAKVLQKTRGLVAIAPLARGDVLAATHFREEERWVDRYNPAQQVTAKELIGLEALRPIAIGAALDSRDFKPAELVARGQVVTVYAVSGGLKIKTSAKALQIGKLHELISVQNDKTGEKIEGTVIGRGVVVLGTIDEKTEAQLREMK
ncbi:MAG: flagellar basal body P-ring formation chaperone FlgA, partial [Phycisphaerae bacterium]